NGRSDHSSRPQVSLRLKQPTRKLRRAVANARKAALRFPIWPCSVWGLPSRSVSESLVRSYRTFSPLLRDSESLAAVCFLWHFPSLTAPRITRPTALRSSDFPPSTKVDGDRPSACQSHDFMPFSKFRKSDGSGEWNSKGTAVVG